MLTPFSPSIQALIASNQDTAPVRTTPFWQRPPLKTIGLFGNSGTSIGFQRKSGPAGTIVYGNDFDNVISLNPGGTSSNLLGSPSVAGVGAMVGGRNNDTYMIAPGQQVIVADLQGGRRDVVDLTGLDRQNARWGYLAIRNDILLFDFTSRTSVLMRDPLGKESSNNTIEFLRLDFRRDGSRPDGSPFPVDPQRSQDIAPRDFLTGLSQQVQGAANLGFSLNFFSVPSPQGPIRPFDALIATTDPVTGTPYAVNDYSAFNTILATLQGLGGPTLAAVLTAATPADPWPGGFSAARKAADVAATVMSLPTTDKLGFGAGAALGFAGAQAAVETAWVDANTNLQSLA